MLTYQNQPCNEALPYLQGTVLVWSARQHPGIEM